MNNVHATATDARQEPAHVQVLHALGKVDQDPQALKAQKALPTIVLCSIWQLYRMRNGNEQKTPFAPQAPEQGPY